MYYLTNLFNLKNISSNVQKVLKVVFHGSESDYNDDTFMYNITTIPDVIFLFDEIFFNAASIQKPYA